MRETTQIDVLTLFPNFFDSPIDQSILGRAISKKIVKVSVHNLRNFAFDKRGSVDDKPFGGGAGMVVRVDVLVRGVESIALNKKDTHVVLLDPKGKQLKQKIVEKLSKKKRILLVSGHYEGVDERFTKNWVDEVISIGDYILTGGEIPALVLIDSIVRLQKNVLGNKKSTEFESFSQKKGDKLRLLDFPAYTRPEIFRGKRVPKILLQGDHKKIKHWRETKAFEITKKNRPDLITSSRKGL
jgi:tRNA (guanine37-N1)-methyltransferase